MTTARTTDVPILRLERTFAAPRERVFRAWTDAAELSRWFAPSEEHVAVLPFDNIGNDPANVVSTMSRIVERAERDFGYADWGAGLGLQEVPRDAPLRRREGLEARLVEGQSALSLVEQKARELARTLLASEPCVKVFVFGSRATGRSVTRSDIDLGFDLGHPIAPEVLAALREAFDDLPILQRVDVVDFSSVDETFRTIALQGIKSLYERQAA
jgi:predicted nucleotidyltransferase